MANPADGDQLKLQDYAQAYSSFRWDIPERFNIGVDVCDRWADREPSRVAIIESHRDHVREVTYGALKQRSNQIANLLQARGLQAGDRVGVMASQRTDTAAIHIAIYKCGAIAVPLFTLFGEDALRHRLNDSGARLLFVEAASLAKIQALEGSLPGLLEVICLDPAAGHAGLDALLDPFGPDFMPYETLAESPALIIYTSGTTGPSKGALLAHRVLLGHLPGVEMSHGGFPQPGDRLWTPADWAWIGGLLDVLMPGLHHGVAVVACRFEKFTAELAFDLIAKCQVRNLFLPATALKLMRALQPVGDRRELKVRSIASGGETLGTELVAWGQAVFGITINEFYGQTECNMVISSCEAWFAPKLGAAGRAAPGHRIAIVDGSGQPVDAKTEGEIAVRSPDPVMFSGYWNRPDQTASKFAGEWLLTGDRGWMDEDGFIHFLGRNDDVITSAGYRIGPGEIEDCILRHPAVLAAGVVGVPDTQRTEVVAAFVVLRPGVLAGKELADEIRNLVRTRLGAHQYPRLIRFLDSLPLTATGKIMRRELRVAAADWGEDPV